MKCTSCRKEKDDVQPVDVAWRRVGEFVGRSVAAELCLSCMWQLKKAADKAIAAEADKIASPKLTRHYSYPKEKGNILRRAGATNIKTRELSLDDLRGTARKR